MPNPFAVSALSNSVKLDANRQGEVSFSVTNNSGHQVRAGARLELASNPGGQVPAPTVAPASGPGTATIATTSPAPAATIKWLSFVEEGQPAAPAANPQYTERDFNIGSTQQFRVRIAAPPNAPGGTQTFYVHFTDVQMPDEEFTDSPIVGFEVPAPAAKKSFPWWIPLAAIGAVVVIGAIIAALVLSGSPTPTPTPVAVFTPTIPPVTAAVGSNLLGTWLNVDSNVQGLSQLDITASGSFLMVHATAVKSIPLDWGQRGGTFTTSPFNITFDLGSTAGKHTLKLTEFESGGDKKMLVEESLNGGAFNSLVFRNQTCVKIYCFQRPSFQEINGVINRGAILLPTATPK